tara:strand:+ start:31 stop:501 length:471 start_codon:yes stop_codon:yes gene_type:complete
MRILGIDPGSRITGYGIIDTPKHYVTSGIIRLLSDDMPERLQTIHEDLSTIIAKHQPNCVVIEQVFFSKNAQSALKLGYARGVAMLAAKQAHCPVFEYTPRAMKQAVTGHGNASKADIQTMVQNHLHLSARPSIDAADALGLAICHQLHAAHPLMS